MLELKNPPKVAVVGAGYWGRNLVRDFRDLGALRLICDSNPVALEAMRARYPGMLFSSDFSEAISDLEIKAVVLATPARDHAAQAFEALSRGLDVFVEKPLALTVDDGRAMVDLAKSKGRIIMVDHLLHRHPAVERLKAMVRAGDLGRIARVMSVRRNFGIVRTDENALWSLAPHDISMALALVDAPLLEVQAVGGGWLASGHEDMAEAFLSFGGGVSATISVSWLHPVKEQRLCVIGLEGMGVFDDTAPWEEKLVVYPHKIRWRGNVPFADKAEGEAVPLAPVPPLESQCQAFLKAVATRVPPEDSHGEEALKVLSVLARLDKSLKSRLPVPFEDAFPGKGHQIHPTAFADPGAVIGDGARIWHFSHVLAGSVIGENVNIGQNVVVGPRAKIGRGSKIQNNVSVDEGVEIEEDVFCGPSMVFTNVHNPRAFIGRMGELKKTLVRKGASIGANATIVCGHELGEYCFIAAGSVVASNVKAHALMAGVPARQAGWMCVCGVRLPESLICPACAKKYKEAPGGLEEAGD